ncbi:MAG: hypothetical protein EAZ30_02720 [Betaproteobacteria bacterium]|nr:MAG: hypothetical protein EAZ30_02720 [Betaproteobacteria bacterium]
MSQHYYETTDINGNALKVTLGFDRPLGHFFMFIEREGEDEPIYSNLHEDEAFSLDLNHYKKVLDGMSIEVPKSMFEQVMLDEKFLVGNRYVWHKPDATFNEHG